MKSYDKKMSTFIKEILSENPFYNPDMPHVSNIKYWSDINGDFGKMPFKNENNLADIFNYETYTEMLESINKDIYYEKKLKQWLEDDGNQMSSTSPKINTEMAEDAFLDSFSHLIENWHKFTPRSKDTDYIHEKTTNFSFSIFKAIYRRCPQLCVNVFPVIIFIIADFFYSFCEISYTGKKDILPEELTPDMEEKIYALFYKIMTQDHKTYYLLSLLNSKGTFYAKSSLDIGEEIRALVFDEYKKHEKSIIEFICACEICDCEDPAEYAVQHPEFICESDICALDKCYHDKCSSNEKNPKDCDLNDCDSKKMYVRFHALMGAQAIIDDWSDEEIIMSGINKLKKRFSDNLKKKQENRKERSSTFPTEIMVGENYLAFLNFLKTQPDNCWKEGVDKAATLYVINHITGWISLHLLYNTYPHADPEYGLSLFDITHLHTLYFIYEKIYEESDYGETNDDKSNHRKMYHACVQQLLSDAQKIYQTASKEFSSDYNGNVTFGNNSYPLDTMFLDKLGNLNWFNHINLAEVLTYHTYIQYMNSIYTSTADEE